MAMASNMESKPVESGANEQRATTPPGVLTRQERHLRRLRLMLLSVAATALASVMTVDNASAQVQAPAQAAELPPPQPMANIASGEISSPAQMQSGSLLLKMQNGYRIATRMNTDIDVHVSGLVARVKVRQEFQNSGAEWVEGIYVFPLPDEAAVDQLRMHIGERIIEGEIREKEEARREYEQARNNGQKASLVEQQRANLFTSSIANIGPGETVSVEIEYLETVAIDGGEFSLRFPLTITPRYIPGTALADKTGSGWSADTTSVPDASRITPPMVASSTDHKLRFSASINLGTALEYLQSRYHRIDVEVNRNHVYDLTLASADGSLADLNHDLELNWRATPQSTATAFTFSEIVADQEHVLLMILPPEGAAQSADAMPRELTFVIDTSGSMQGTSLAQAKRALSLALDGLRSEDTFEIIQFNSITQSLFGQTMPATRARVDMAKRYVAGLNATGGTEMRGALQTALGRSRDDDDTESLLIRQVIFVTDGSVGNEDELYQLIESQLGDARLFTVGIGSAPNSWFMRKAAEAGRGTFTLISALHEVNEKMGRLFAKLEQPQLTDIDVQWPSGVQPEMYPQVVPDLYAGEPVFVRARLNGTLRNSDVLVVRGDSPTGQWSRELTLADNSDAAGVAALWARARIDDLMDQKRRGREETEVREHVLDTALTHHLVSRYTSLVAIDKTPSRPQDLALTGEQVPNLMAHGQSQAAIFGFPATATTAPALRLQGMLWLIAGLALLLLTIKRRDRHAQIA